MYLDARAHTLTFETMLQKSDSANQKSDAKKIHIKGMNYGLSQLKPQSAKMGFQLNVVEPKPNQTLAN